MTTLRQALGVVAAVVLALATLSTVALATRFTSSGHLSASPSRVGSGGRVVVRGSGWSQAPGCRQRVAVLAYVVGISPYPSAALETGHVKGGRFTVVWSAPKVRDRLAWTIRGVQRCRTRTIVAYTTLTIG